MKNNILCELAVGCFLTSTAGTRAADADQQKALILVAKLGGTFEADARKNVIMLTLADTKVTDDDLKHLKVFTGVRKLYLQNTGITDAGLANVKDWTDLQTLSLNHTKVTDTGLDNLKRAFQTQIAEPVSHQGDGQGIRVLEGANHPSEPSPKIDQGHGR